VCLLPHTPAVSQDLEAKLQGAIASLPAAGEREASLTAEKAQLGAELEEARGQVAEGPVVAAQAEEAPVLEDEVCVCVCVCVGWRVGPACLPACLA
jgi:hypothetical protein